MSRKGVVLNPGALTGIGERILGARAARQAAPPLPFTNFLRSFHCFCGTEITPNLGCMWAAEGECGAQGCEGCSHGGAAPKTHDCDTCGRRWKPDTTERADDGFRRRMARTRYQETGVPSL